MKNISKKFGAMVVLFVAVLTIIPIIQAIAEGYQGSLIQCLLQELED